MNDSASLKMKPGFAFLMALALVTTTFAGVSFANPTTGTGPSNTMASMDYDELELIVDFDANGTDYTSLTSEIHVWDDDNFSAWFGPEDMMEESDNTSWNTHWADISLVLFFNGSAGVSPMADEGTWYYVDAYVNDSYGYTVGQAYTQICMDNGSVCEDDQNGPDIEDIFNQIDANQDGAITASEIIDFENMERESNNESNLTAEEEADIADDVAEFDTGYDDGMGNTEDANDSMLEINEFTEMFLERNTLITGADAYLEDGVVRIEIHDDLDEVDYVWILIHDGEGNELINETYAGDENGDFQDWTSPDCCNEDGMYYITLYFYDEDNMSIDSDSFTLGGYDNDQMMFDMFDTDMSGNVSIDEYLDAMDNASDINGEDPMDNATRTMISNMFMDEDTNEDGELDLDEFLSFWNTLNNMGGDDDDTRTDAEMMRMMLDADQDGNITLSEMLVMVEENQSDASKMTTFYTNLFNNEDVDGNEMLDFGEFSVFHERLDELMGDDCYDVMAGDAILSDGTFEDQEGNETELMAGDTAPSDGEFCEWGEMDTDVILLMLDTNGDDQLSLAEILVDMTSGDETADELMMLGFVFEYYDDNGDELLDHNEFGLFWTHMQSGEEYIPTNAQILSMYDTDGDGNLSLSEVLAAVSNGNESADELMMFGWIFESHDWDMSGSLDANEFFWFMDSMQSGEEYTPTPVQMMDLFDTDGDGSVSLAETIAFLNAGAENQDETLSEIEEEYLGVLFGFMDADSNGLLNASEFPEFYYALDSEEDQGDMGDDDGQGQGQGNETDMVCYDMVNHVILQNIDNSSECEAAGFMWTENINSGDGEGQDNDSNSEEQGINFDSMDVWFEQWNDQTMQLVLVELGVVDSPEEIERLSMMADGMYGNNDSVLDESEVEMLMALYAMSLNVDDISEGLTLDGQNGTAVDFWVEIDGLLEGDDVVFVRIGTVIEFPVTNTYDNSTSHAFVVTNTDVEDDGGAGEDFTEDEICETTVRVHNSESWDISSVVTTGDELVFTYEETNDMWFAEDDNCDASGMVTFNLVKVEDSAMPEEEEEDWTWEDEEMNLLPICDWFYTVTLANGTMMSEQGVEEASGEDRIITLVDDAAYDIGIYCWDPEGGNMTVNLSSPLGNSTNTSMGYAWSWMSFALPAGTGGNFSIDISWTDGYHAESGTLTVVATGDGSTGDISDVEVDSEGIPGFTAVFGIVALLGAAMLSGRRD